MKPRYSSLAKLVVASVASIALFAMALPASAAPGDLVVSLPLSIGQGLGVSVASDCDQRIYYTISGDTRLHSMDKFGNHITSVPILDPAGNSLFIDEMAYDFERDILWGMEHDVNPVRVYRIDRTTGSAVLAFNSTTVSNGIYRDGITVDIIDDTIWISGDVSDTIEQYSLTGTFLTQITPTDAGGNTLGAISGIQVGIGDLMYLGRNGFGEIVRVRKSDGGFIGGFATPGGRDEGLECDPLSFAPKYVIWSRDFGPPGRIDAVEVDPATCRCGGVTPTTPKTWGGVKGIYR